jgi:hypothetical protein
MSEGMKKAGRGRWLVLAIVILALFGGCSAFAGTVSKEWTPAFMVWIALVVPLKALNDRYGKVQWPMEFITWSILLLIALNLVWLRYSGA